MSISRVLTVAFLSTGLMACSENGEVQPEDRVKRADTQTELTVSVDKNPNTVLKTASAYTPNGVFNQPTLNQIVQSATAFIIPSSIAAPVPGASIFLVYMKPNGVVIDVLTPEDGLVINDQGNGTYKVTMPDDLRVDGMVVTNFYGLEPVKGKELPNGSFYAPAAGEKVELSEGSTAATRLTYSFINSFGGLSAKEIKTIIDNVTRLANKDVLELAKGGELSLDNLYNKLDSSVGSLIQSELLSAKSQAIPDATAYLGDYNSFATSHYLLTSTDGKLSEVITGIFNKATKLSFAQPAQGQSVNKGVLAVNQTATNVLANEKSITSTLGWSSNAFTEFKVPALSSNTAVSNFGRMEYKFAQHNLDSTMTVQSQAVKHAYAIAELEQIANGSSQTVGAIITAGRTEVSSTQAQTGGGNLTLNGYVSTDPELLFLKPDSYAITSLTGKYGAVYHLRDFSQSPWVVKRGLEKFDAANGVLTSSQLFNANQMKMPSGNVPESSYVKASIGNATFKPTSGNLGSLDGQYGTYPTKTLVDKNSRLLQSQIGTSPSAEAGYVTAVKLPEAADIKTIEGKTYQLFGSESVLNFAAVGYGQVKGVLGFTGPAKEYYISLESNRAVNKFENISKGTPATTSNDRVALVGGNVTKLDITSNGEIEFLNSDRTYKGFIQEGGDFIVLHSDFATGSIEENNYELSDFILYAVCTSGCTKTLPKPVPSFSVGGTVTGLSGTVVLALNGKSLSVAANGAFTFAEKVKKGTSYAVSITTQPTGQTCTLTNASGTMAEANVTNVTLACAATTP